MIDMSYEINEQKDFSLPMEAPKYPQGLRICLTDKELKKLNIEGIPQVGEKHKAEIVIEVVEVEAMDGEGSEKKHKVEFQIKEMELKKDKKEDDMTASTIIYGD